MAVVYTIAMHINKGPIKKSSPLFFFYSQKPR